MFFEFKIAFFLSLRERICSPKRICSLKNFEFAPKRICSLKNFLQVCVYINKLFTPFWTYRRKRMSMNILAIAGNFFLFIEVLEKFQVVYGTFWTQLYLAYHRTFEILFGTFCS